jgi:hypothetical protein
MTTRHPCFHCLDEKRVKWTFSVPGKPAPIGEFKRVRAVEEVHIVYCPDCEPHKHAVLVENITQSMIRAHS